MKIKIIVDGQPMGKGRPRVSVFGKSRIARAYTPKETVQYESKVVSAYKEALREKGILEEQMFFLPNEEICATIFAYFPINKTHYKLKKKTGKVELDKVGQAQLNGKLNPTKKPDCDNIAKICLDALNGIAYHDDSAVTCLFVAKRYSEYPRVEIILERLEHYGE